jgi:hypothetical protein
MTPNGSGTAQSGNRTVSATGNGLTIITRASGFLRKTMRFTGSVSHPAAGKVVEIQRSGGQTGGRWVFTTQATVGSSRTFVASWRVSHTGSFAVRAVLGTSAGGFTSGQPVGSTGPTAAGWPTVRVILYRFAIATIFGPGFWGSNTACGRRLHRTTLGVANRTLPCGTPISLYYRGRTITVPVIDRGPYANHADWDLTEATARALHMNSTEPVGAAALPRK